MPATTVETGAMPGAPYVVPQPMTMDRAYMTGSPYTTYGGYSMSPYMPAMPAMDGLDHSQGKWFAPGEALPPGYVITTHPEGHTAPQEGHAMSEMASASFVIPASSAAAAVKTGSAVKSKKSKKRASRSTSTWFARASFRYGVRTDQDNSFAFDRMEKPNTDMWNENTENADQKIFASCDAQDDHNEARQAVHACDTGKQQSMLVTTGSSIAERLLAFKQVMFEMLWKEVQFFDKERLDAANWANYMIEKLFAFDFLYKLIVDEEIIGAIGDGAENQKKTRDEAFLMAVKAVEQEAQIMYFLRHVGLNAEITATTEEIERTVGLTQQEEELPRHAQGSAEEASLDMSRQQYDDQKELETMADGCAIGSTTRRSYFNGTNWYVNMKSKINFDDWTATEDEGLDPESKIANEQQANHCLRGGMAIGCDYGTTAPKTYYDKNAVLSKIADKSFDQKEMDVRGGAGGASTTARKKEIRDVLKDMSSMLDSMPDTQEEGDEQDQIVDKIVKDIQQLAENWKGRRPTKDHMKVRLDHLTERLDLSKLVLLTKLVVEENNRNNLSIDSITPFMKNLRRSRAPTTMQKEKEGQQKARALVEIFSSLYPDLISREHIHNEVL